MDEKQEERFLNRLIIYLVVVVVGIVVNGHIILASIEQSPLNLLYFLVLIPAEVGLFVCMKRILELEN